MNSMKTGDDAFEKPVRRPRGPNQPAEHDRLTYGGHLLQVSQVGPVFFHLLTWKAVPLPS